MGSKFNPTQPNPFLGGTGWDGLGLNPFFSLGVPTFLRRGEIELGLKEIKKERLNKPILIVTLIVTLTVRKPKAFES